MSNFKAGVEDIILGLTPQPVGTPHSIQKQGGTPHMKLCSDVHTGVGTPHRINEEKTSMVGVGWGWSGGII